MSVNESEATVARLLVRDITELVPWLAEYPAALWGKQIEYDRLIF